MSFLKCKLFVKTLENYNVNQLCSILVAEISKICPRLIDCCLDQRNIQTIMNISQIVQLVSMLPVLIYLLQVCGWLQSKVTAPTHTSVLANELHRGYKFKTGSFHFSGIY